MTGESLAAKRAAIRPLLDQDKPADALAAYYAFYHPENRTALTVYPPGARRAKGYLTSSRTGIDLFRPLVTLRFPTGSLDEAPELLYQALAPGSSVFIHAPAGYRNVLGAFFDVHTQQDLYLFHLDQRRFEPEVNVLVTRASTPDGLPRFTLRPRGAGHEGEIGASASVNWLSPHFADIAVYTNPQYRQRGWGRNVVVALVQHLLQSGRTPLYEVEQQNEASQQLARSVGFVNTGADKVLLEATLRPRC
ncbi:MAG: GNAT family N-acetyltransferase [Candidatus Promineifilaceae bacterium]|nr:GNAT family N-acetyltransferase [Candidatus Promineifilaceae bacterium]